MNLNEDSKGRILDEMPYNEKRELEASTSSRKTRHHVEDEIPVKNSVPELFVSERTAGTKMEKSLRKRRSSDMPKFSCNSTDGPKA